MDLAVHETPANGDCLYLRVFRAHVRPKPGEGICADRVAFNVHKGALSADWCRRASPERTRCGGKKPKTEYFVAALRFEDVTSIDRLRLELTPTDDNPAHVDIRGDLDGRGDFLDATLTSLRKRAFWVIPPPGEPDNRNRCPDPDQQGLIELDQ